MKPVRDSDGEYRYTIGVQCEVDRKGATKKQLSALKSMMKQLPSSFEASLQPLAELSSEEKQSAAARNAQMRSAMCQFTKLVWMSEPATLRAQVESNTWYDIRLRETCHLSRGAVARIHPGRPRPPHSVRYGIGRKR